MVDIIVTIDLQLVTITGETTIQLITGRIIIQITIGLLLELVITVDELDIYQETVGNHE
jgi:hypothetical protein